MAEMAASRWASYPRRSPDADHARVEHLLGDRVAARTQRAYAADWAAFSRWSAGQGVTIPPATPELVAVYLAAAACAIRSGTGEPLYQRSTLLRWASSVGAVHTRLGHPDPCDQPPAREVIAHIRSFDDNQRHARSLLSGDVLGLLEGLPEPGWPREPVRRRGRLIVTLGFWAGLGPSELTGLPVVDARVEDTTHALILGQGRRTRTIPPADNPAACASCSLIGWRELIDPADTTGTQAARNLIKDATEPARHITVSPAPVAPARDDLPLIRRIRRGGTITPSPVTPQVIRQILQALASRTGLDARTVTGMSLRASRQLDQLIMEARTQDR
jgi:site-specific recombinase XerC